MTAAAAPQIAAQRAAPPRPRRPRRASSRRGAGAGESAARRPPRRTRRRPPATRRRQARRRAAAPSAVDDPDTRRREQAGGGEHEEQRRAHDEGDDGGRDRGQAGGDDARGARAAAARRPPPGTAIGVGRATGARSAGCAAATRRHGSLGDRGQRRVAGPAAGRAPAAANRSRLAPSVTIPPSGTRRRAGDGLAVDPARHPPGQLDERHRAVGRHVEDAVVGLEQRIVDPHRGPRRPSDDVAPGRRGRRRRRRPGRRRTWRRRPGRLAAAGGGRAGPSVAAADGPRPGRCVSYRVHPSAVDLEVVGRAEAERVGELADPIVGRARGDDDPAAGGSGQLEGGDERGRHAPMGVPTEAEGERESAVARRRAR